MLSVNCSSLKDLLSELEVNTEELETSQLNLFRNINNSTISWHDGNSILFRDYMDIENAETKKMLELIVNRKKVLQKICDNYSSIGKKIRCNIQNYNKISNQVKSCIGQCNDILSSLNSMTYDVTSVRSIITKVKQELTDIDTSISDYFKKVMAYEKDILAAIKSIDDITIKEYTYDLVQTTYKDRCVVDMVSLTKDMEQIDLYIKEEQERLDKEFEKLFECLIEYNSTNTSTLSNSINDLKANATIMNNKRVKYTETLSKVKEIYQASGDTVVSMMSKEV